MPQQFLETLGGRWNISLFHYRNHGADFGRVLCAFEVPKDEMTEFRSFLEQLGYPSVSEEANAAYWLFLSTRLHHLEENLGAAAVEFSPDELREFREAFSKIEIQGSLAPESAVSDM